VKKQKAKKPARTPDSKLRRPKATSEKKGRIACRKCGKLFNSWNTTLNKICPGCNLKNQNLSARELALYNRIYK
jgi:phage FluMu protein Com